MIELMIVVAVVAILAAVAYPSYTRYLARTYRAAAQGFMLQVSNLQQRYLLDQRAFAPDLATLNISAPADVQANYTITTAPKQGSTPPGFTVTAIPTGAQSSRDAVCGTLTIDESGAKAVSGGGTSCW